MRRGRPGALILRLRSLPSWLLLVGIVVGSSLVRAWASRGVPTPWIAPDEMVYGLIGQSLYRTGHFAILGHPTGFYSAVVPAVTGVPLSLGDLELGYSVLKVVQAVVMSLAAVPVYLWGRTLMPARWALVAAALSVAFPGLAYSGLVVSEVEFYLVIVLCAWAMAAALQSPTSRRQALFMFAFTAAVATRLQAVAIVPAFFTAYGLDGLLGRSRRRLLDFAPTLIGMALLAGAWSVWRLASGGSLLGAYAGASGSYEPGKALRFVVYHAGDLSLLVGVLPVCALLVVLVDAFRGRDLAPQVRAYLSVSVSLAVWFVLEVGVFASREVHLVAERNLIALAPMLFIGFTYWLARGGPDDRRTRSLAGLVVIGGTAILPLGRLATRDAMPDAFSLIPLVHLSGLTSVHVAEAVFVTAICAAIVLFALIPRRAAALLVILLLAALVGGSVSASREVTAQARAQKLRLVGPTRRWIDANADGPVAYLYDGQAYWNGVWENVFWNRRVRWIYDLPGPRIPGPLPQRDVELLPDGRLRLSGGSFVSAPFAVSAINFDFVGDRLATALQFGTDRQALVLWKTESPLRISTLTYNVGLNGDIYAGGRMTVFACRSGTIRLTLLVKEPQTIRILLDDRLVRKRSFPATQTWWVTIPVRPTPAGSDRVCTIKFIPGGLLGSTQLAFERR